MEKRYILILKVDWLVIKNNFKHFGNKNDDFYDGYRIRSLTKDRKTLYQRIDSKWDGQEIKKKKEISKKEYENYKKRKIIFIK